MIKYKIGFTVPAEVLFGMIAKFLPIEDLAVEEIVDHPPAPGKPLPKIAQMVSHASKHKPKRAKRAGKGPNLKEGINGILMSVLEDGAPQRAIELEKPLKAAGFSPNSVGSRLQNLRNHGVVQMLGDGKWRLTQVEVKKQVSEMVA